MHTHTQSTRQRDELRASLQKDLHVFFNVIAFLPPIVKVLILTICQRRKENGLFARQLQVFLSECHQLSMYAKEIIPVMTSIKLYYFIFINQNPTKHNLLEKVIIFLHHFSTA